MEKNLMNKRGQLAIPIITFAILVVLLLFTAPLVLKVANVILTPFGTAIGDQDNTAGNAITSIHDTITSWWDIIVMIGLALFILLFLLSAFLVDTHPAFMIVFMLAGAFTVMFAPLTLDALEKIWDSDEFFIENNQMPMARFVLDYYGSIITGVMILGGVILYARIRSGGRGV